jgi:hypothetical protein
MKQFTANKAPEDMFTKARLKKMSLSPITYPPSKRRYKLYKLENARPIENNVGYSLLISVKKSNERNLSPENLREMVKRLHSQYDSK